MLVADTVRPVVITGATAKPLRRTAVALLVAWGMGTWPPAHADGTGNELSYDAWVDSPRRLKCLYGYAADKTGDHAAAIRIFEDCIERWNDVYSMIWLAQIYETGVGVPRDVAYATALMKRGAETDDPAGYASLARYLYGVALVEGRGVAPDAAAGLHWLRLAAEEGVEDAREYIARHFSHEPLPPRQH